jgi:eukaryotic-like serine/threonine-protein kinase
MTRVTARGMTSKSAPPPGPAQLALVGTVLAGRYRIEKLLGSGGMGSVYRAEHVHMRKAVAIKVLHREMTFMPEVVARFEREAVAAARIEHPNVAAATDFGRLEDGAFYLVLEYVEGQSLRALLKQEKKLSSLRALHITRQIADALSAAHGAGIVHRDLKPDNVMLIDRDGDGDFVKVLDFGIAKVKVEDQSSQPLTQFGSIFGTPEYMAPEQAQGLPVDGRADLYTLGILLYEMLTGSTPFIDDDMVVVLTRTLTAEPPPLPANVEPAVDQLVRALLAKSPEARPASAAELVEHVDQLLDGAMKLSISQLNARGLALAAQPAVSVQFSDTVLNVARPGSTAVPLVYPGPRSRPSSALGSLLGKLRSALPLLRHSVRIGGQPVPIWGVILGGTVFATVLFSATILLFGGNSGASRNTDRVLGAHTKTNELDKELAALIERAGTGDATALAQLAARPEAERGALEWLALGQGYCRAGQYESGMKAYEKAIALDAGLAADPKVLTNVRRAADEPESATRAVALAAKLGASGGDLLYDVWESNRRSKGRSETARSAKDYLDKAGVRAAASPALQIALDLSKPQPCAQYKRLLPRAVEHADTRSLTFLKALTVARGCGFLGLRDCYSCIRGSKDLSNALKNAEARPAPGFEASAQ